MKYQVAQRLLCNYLNNILFYLIFIAALLFLSLTFSGCTKDISKLPNAPESDVTEFPEQRNPKLSAHIFVDDSESMAGYAMPCKSCNDKFRKYGVPESNYYKLLQALPEAMITAGTYNSIKYHSISNIIPEMAAYKFRNSLRSDFYKSGTSPIDQVIDSKSVCTGNNLAVIITDLYQKESYIEPLVQKLTRKCLEGRYAVGVWGIKSQFKGTIFDRDIEDGSAEYSTVGKPIGEYKPFYLIILGKHHDVEALYENLHNSVEFLNHDNENFNILSPYLVNTPSVLDIETAPEKADLNCLRNKKNEIRAYATPTARNSTSAWVKTSFKYSLLKYSPPLLGSKFDIEVAKVETFTANKFVECANVKKDTVSVIVANKGNNTLSLEVKNNIKELPEGIYRYEIIVRPSEDSYKLPEWWTLWGTEDPTRDPLWKTLHQRLFLRSLWKAYYELSKPMLGKFYYIVGK